MYDIIKETPANAIGNGKIGGTVEAGDNPPVRNSSMVRRKKFAGCEVFVVGADIYNTCKRAKLQHERFSKSVGDNETAMAIREYGKANPGKGIMIQDEASGSISYLRLPRGKTGIQF